MPPPRSTSSSRSKKLPRSSPSTDSRALTLGTRFRGDVETTSNEVCQDLRPIPMMGLSPPARGKWGSRKVVTFVMPHPSRTGEAIRPVGVTWMSGSVSSRRQWQRQRGTGLLGAPRPTSTRRSYPARGAATPYWLPVDVQLEAGFLAIAAGGTWTDPWSGAVASFGSWGGAEGPPVRGPPVAGDA